MGKKIQEGRAQRNALLNEFLFVRTARIFVRVADKKLKNSRLFYLVILKYA